MENSQITRKNTTCTGYYWLLRDLKLPEPISKCKFTHWILLDITNSVISSRCYVTSTGSSNLGLNLINIDR